MLVTNEKKSESESVKREGERERGRARVASEMAKRRRSLEQLDYSRLSVRVVSCVSFAMPSPTLAAPSSPMLLLLLQKLVSIC